jgi:SAM-dependent methyltransferase
MSEPEFIENFWIARARTLAGTDDTGTTLEKLRPSVQHLSDLFTVGRPAGAFPDYAAEPALLTAYGLFFFPQSYARARIALDQPIRFRGWRPRKRDREPLRVLDLGSGPGPCGLAAVQALRQLEPGAAVALTAFDHSPAALAALRELVRAGSESAAGADGTVGGGEALAGVSVDTRTVDLRRGISGGVGALSPQDVIIAGFAVNELFGGDAAALREWLAALRRALAPGGLLVVLEPALRETALPLQQAADSLVAEGVFHRWAPDLGDAAFPFPADGKFHPHEVRRWTAPESLAFLNRTLFREIGVLKFSYTALGVEMPPALASDLASDFVVFRLVSPLEVLKGRVVCAVVTVDGKRLSLEVPTRGLSKSEVKAFAMSYERGDVIGIRQTFLRPLGREPGFFRASAVTEFVPFYRGGER